MKNIGNDFIAKISSVLIILVIVSVLATFGLWHFEDDITPFESLYWAVITMTTVGYGDITPVTTAGKLISMSLAVSGLGLYAYLGTMIVHSITETSLREVIGMDKCNFKNHVVICGWNPTARITSMELLAQDKQLAVITENKDEVPKIKRLGDRKDLFTVFGDHSKREVLLSAGVENAQSAILASDDDSKNLISIINLKKLNPNARIIVKTSREELKETMVLAGVTYVSTPDTLVGKLMASATVEPTVANFIEDLTTSVGDLGYDLRQYNIPDDYKGSVGKLCHDIKRQTNAVLLALARKEASGRWDIHPNPRDNILLKRGDRIILLGSSEEFERVDDILKTR